jgi:hypothetical protein
MSLAGAWTIVAVVCGGLALLAAGMAGAVYLLRPVKRVISYAGDALEDWAGTPARRGVPRRPGVMERLERIEGSQRSIDARLSVVETQVTPDGGKSMHDKVTRIARAAGVEQEE